MAFEGIISSFFTDPKVYSQMLGPILCFPISGGTPQITFDQKTLNNFIKPKKQ